MLMELSVNSHTSRIASVAELRRKLASFAAQQFREIWVSVNPDGPGLCALMNTKLGWLVYLRHNEGDIGFSSRNPMFDESDATLSGLVFDGRFGRERVAVITYRLSNGQELANWVRSGSEKTRIYDISANCHILTLSGRTDVFGSW